MDGERRRHGVATSVGINPTVELAVKDTVKTVKKRLGGILLTLAASVVVLLGMPGDLQAPGCERGDGPQQVKAPEPPNTPAKDPCEVNPTTTPGCPGYVAPPPAPKPLFASLNSAATILSSSAIRTVTLTPPTFLQAGR